MYIYIYRAQKVKGPTKFTKQIWPYTKSHLICTEDLCLYTASWHSTNYNWIQIHRTKMMTNSRVMYLSDSPDRTQIWRAFSPTVYICMYIYIHIHMYIYMYVYIYSYMPTHIYTYIHVYMYIYISLSLSLYIYLYIYLHIYLYIYIFIYIHIFTYMCTGVRRPRDAGSSSRVGRCRRPPLQSCWCAYVCMCLCVRDCVCVCVCIRERERLCVYVCVGPPPLLR